MLGRYCGDLLSLPFRSSNISTPSGCLVDPADVRFPFDARAFETSSRIRSHQRRTTKGSPSTFSSSTPFTRSDSRNRAVEGWLRGSGDHPSVYFVWLRG